MPTRRILQKKAAIDQENAVDPYTAYTQPNMFNKSFTPILVILLLVAAYFLGMLTTKVQYLEKGTVSSQTAAAQPSNAPQNPQLPQASPTPLQKQNVTSGHFPVKGNAGAKVKIIEFADFRCPFCERFFSQTEPQLIKDYVDTGKASIYFRQYPFLGPASVVAANAAECANDQGKFWDFHDYLYKNQPAETDTSLFTTAGMTQIATTLGMDGTQFSSCLDGKTDDAKAQADLADGQKAGVNGTPTFFVNGTPLVGAQPYAAFKTLIDAELAK